MTSPELVVLGMIGLGARSGYEIKRTVELSIRFFCPAQIYPSLAKLEQAGLITGRDRPHGNRRRRVYTRTVQGTRTLEQWLRDDQPLPFELRDIGMVKLFFADALEPCDAAALLTMVKARSAARIARLHQIRPEGETAAQHGNIHPLLTLELGIAFHQAIVDVCERFEHRRKT